MLRVFCGNDVVSVRKKAHAFVRGHDGEVSYVTPEKYTEGIFVDLAGSASLFGGQACIVIDTPSEQKEMQEAVWQMLPEFASSENTFVLIEGALLASVQKKLAKYAEEVEVCTAPKEARFNSFALSDAFAARDKKTLWVLFVRAKQNGLSDEEIIGILFWQLKMLRLAEKTGSPEEAGQKPFVWNKAKRALGRFKEGELTDHSRELLRIYHEGHMGECDTTIALERWILGL